MSNLEKSFDPQYAKNYFLGYLSELDEDMSTEEEIMIQLTVKFANIQQRDFDFTCLLEYLTEEFQALSMSTENLEENLNYYWNDLY